MIIVAQRWNDSALYLIAQHNYISSFHTYPYYVCYDCRGPQVE